ncbi:PDZ domain (Also known as DHR or GLGF) [Maioricimonas rarisocia]|uniref:PDZ domain (Also known as DHR or GLGF) n=1 Tax=Maioricimonas rarisocia TaxID=2528026 RepID=A0A517Z004_9PLAN|nr:PDZ domain-containing protein [Maioricimonas rarisocia]QDU35820.1 PDZ domain (Also known as DHR or GLGF) [Maioricimonas rarisocia]
MNGMPSRNHILCCLAALASAAFLSTSLVSAAPPADDVAAAPAAAITGAGENGAVVQGRIELKADDPAAIPQPRQLRPLVQPHTVIENGQLLIRRGDGSFEAIQLQGGPRNLIQLRANASASNSEFVIGLLLSESIDLARAQLHLGETGVAVRRVVPDSPAAKAGIEQHDIIIAAGDRDITSAQVLHEAIDEAGENELTLTILRGGVEQAVAVTPRRRGDVQPPRPDGQPELFSPDSPTEPGNRLPGGGFPWRGIPEEFSPPGRNERQIREMRKEINMLKERVEQLEQMIEKLTEVEQPAEE